MNGTSPPGSLSEGAAERSEAEGVYPDERNHSKISEFICAGVQIFGPEEPSDDTPSVSPCGLTAPSEREPGNVPHNVNHPPAGCFVSGRVVFGGFVWGWVHFTIQLGACETGRVRAIFIAPTKLKEFDILPLIVLHSLSLAFARQLPQGGSRGGVRTIQCAAQKPQRCGRFSSPLRRGCTIHRGVRKCSKTPRGKPGGWGIISQ